MKQFSTVELCKNVWQLNYRKSIFAPHTHTHKDKDKDREIVKQRERERGGLSKSMLGTTTLPTVEHVHITIYAIFISLSSEFYLYIRWFLETVERKWKSKQTPTVHQHFDVALLSTTEQFGKPICKDSIFVRRLKIITTSVKARAYKNNTRVAHSFLCLWMKLYWIPSTSIIS